VRERDKDAAEEEEDEGGKEVELEAVGLAVEKGVDQGIFAERIPNEPDSSRKGIEEGMRSLRAWQKRRTNREGGELGTIMTSHSSAFLPSLPLSRTSTRGTYLLVQLRTLNLHRPTPHLSFQPFWI